MTGYELARRAIEFEYPDRLPMHFPLHGYSDFCRVEARPARIWQESLLDNELDCSGVPADVSLDEWRCPWEHTSVHNMGLVRRHPLTDWGMMDGYPWPDPSAVGRFDGVEANLPEAGDRYVQFLSKHCLFERMHFLRGFEQLMLDLYDAPNQVHALAGKVIEYQIGLVLRLRDLFPGRIHGFATTDDWGSQHGPLIRPELWREFFAPHYRLLSAAAHEAGMHVRLHTCGKVNDLIDDFIDVGFDVLQVQQPRLLGIEEIGRRVAGRICFETTVDIQVTLPHGTRQEIEAEAKLLAQRWNTPAGGLIPWGYVDLAAIGVSPEQDRWQLDVFRTIRLQ